MLISSSLEHCWGHIKLRLIKAQNQLSPQEMSELARGENYDDFVREVVREYAASCDGQKVA